MRAPESVQAWRSCLLAQHYLASEELATAVFLAIRLAQPLLLEGEVGVGKSELARALAACLSAPLYRLQCYEGIDSREALYDWNTLRQILEIRRAEAEGRAGSLDLFSRQYLLPGPCLRALLGRPGDPPPVLLIDEIDRADEAFEAFLLEFLADWAVSVPELGTIQAEVPPVVLLTSNRTRELHDALRRRCLYCWVDYPSFEEELAILRLRAPMVDDELLAAVARAVAKLRQGGLEKAPGVAEAIHWAKALHAFGAEAFTRQAAIATLGAVVKGREDMARAAALLAETGNDPA